MAGYKKSLCEAFLKNDPNYLMRAFSDPQFPEYVKNREERAKFMLTLYSGFKDRGEGACGRFTFSNLLWQASCNMLFGNRSFENKLDEIAQDIMFAVKSKESKDASLCGSIKNKTIKDVCYDKSVKDLNAILDKVWH